MNLKNAEPTRKRQAESPEKDLQGLALKRGVTNKLEDFAFKVVPHIPSSAVSAGNLDSGSAVQDLPSQVNSAMKVGIKIFLNNFSNISVNLS